MPLVSGTEITPTQISSGYLKYVSPNVNTQSQSTVTWYAKDTLGLSSNPATITITSKSYCVAPTLNNVAFVNNNTVLYDWNNNGVDYGVSGSIILEVSTNGGTSYVAIGSVSPTSSPTTVTSPILNSITNGSSVRFRITANGGACVSQSSNVITLTWNKISEINFEITSQEDGSTCYNINVLYGDFVGKIRKTSYIDINTSESVTTINNITASPIFFSNTIRNYEAVDDITITEGLHSGCMTINCIENTIGGSAYAESSFEILDSLGNSFNTPIFISGRKLVLPSTP